MSDSRFTQPLCLRFAPSPTGELHVGGLRTALFNYLLRLKYGGRLILRIEDTDAGRNIPDAESHLIADLTWAGISFDEGIREGGASTPYRQSERGEFYRDAILRLVEAGAVYRCWCEPERLAEARRTAEAAGLPPRYDRRCRKLPDVERRALVSGASPFVWRLATPETGAVTVQDLIRGVVTFQTSHLDDPILIRSDGSATAVFAGAVDDLLMGITHIIRGEEWLASTPYQLIIRRALGGIDPEFGHLPLLLAPDRSKLSKRHPGATVGDLREEGFLPGALNRMLVAIGRGNLAHDEGWDMESLADSFALNRYGRADAVFSMEMLNHQNGQALHRLTPETLDKYAQPFFSGEFPAALEWGAARRQAALILAREGAPHLRAVTRQVGALFTEPILSSESFQPFPNARQLFSLAGQVLAGRPEVWQADDIKQTLAEIGNQMGVSGRELLMPLRLALTGTQHGPELAAIAELLGREETVRRLTNAAR